MSSIAYITDSKLLELHRLNSNSEMNFWRISTNLSFSNFDIGDLVFFISKNKEHMNNKEKGIVGYGKLSKTFMCSPKLMWDKFDKRNGYNTYEEFKEALIRSSKNHKLPKKISSLYLKDVIFFQSPLYLSEHKIELSKNTESYIYIKPEEIVFEILEYGKTAFDIWSSGNDLENKIFEHKLECGLKIAYKEVGDYINDQELLKKAYSALKKYRKDNCVYDFLGKSKTCLYLVKGKDILVVMYYSKAVDYRLLIGQANMIRKTLNKQNLGYYQLYFKTQNNDTKIDELLNSY